MSKVNIIPAPGVVKFFISNLDDDNPVLVTDGPPEWYRPVVALQIHYYSDSDLTHYEPMVVDETGLVCPAYDHLDCMTRGNIEHGNYLYLAHISRPVTNPPRITVNRPFCPCGCMTQVRPGLDCLGDPVGDNRAEAPS